MDNKMWRFSVKNGWDQIDDPWANYFGEDGLVPRRDGWDLRNQVGDPDGGDGAEWFVKDGQIVIDISNPSTFDAVAAADFPSALVLWGQISPMVCAASTYALINEMELAITKLFHATHGHDYANVCMNCDPNETIRQQKERTERQKKHDKMANIMAKMVKEKREGNPS